MKNMQRAVLIINTALSHNFFPKYFEIDKPFLTYEITGFNEKVYFLGFVIYDTEFDDNPNDFVIYLKEKIETTISGLFKITWGDISTEIENIKK